MSSTPLLSRIAVLSGLLLGIFYAAPSPGEELPGTGKTVTPARPTWDTGYFYVEIYDRAIEALGYTVKKPVTLDNPAFYSAVRSAMWISGLRRTYRFITSTWIN
jgi:glycine betaine/proline transport system substrate-binding protein